MFKHLGVRELGRDLQHSVIPVPHQVRPQVLTVIHPVQALFLTPELLTPRHHTSSLLAIAASSWFMSPTCLLLSNACSWKLANPWLAFLGCYSRPPSFSTLDRGDGLVSSACLNTLSFSGLLFLLPALTLSLPPVPLLPFSLPAPLHVSIPVLQAHGLYSVLAPSSPLPVPGL